MKRSLSACAPVFRSLQAPCSPATRAATRVAAMPERRCREVQSRSELTLVPPCLDDDVSERNPLRAIGAFVGTLDLEALGFRHAEERCGAGQPAHDPGLLPKLCLHGCQHRVRRSRRLEAETRRNLEVIWRCRGATPSCRTIADFRNSDASALRAANREFLLPCRELSLPEGRRVAVGEAFPKADANADSIHAKASPAKSLKRPEQRIAACRRPLDQADAGSEDGADSREDPELAERIGALVERRKQSLQESLRASGEGRISEVGPDARVLKKSGRTVGGCNCRIAAEDRCKLIVAEDVVQDGNEAGQLEPMMTKACEDRGLDACVPIPRHPPRSDKGDVARFGRDDDFRCDARNDTHACPAGPWLTRRGSPRTREGKRHFRYSSVAAACRDCSPRDRCLTKSRPRRRLDRWEHEDAIGRHRGKMSAGAPWMRQGAALVEHPFGTVKRWAGMDHFPMRGLEKCCGEFSLMTLGHDFKRVMNELGAAAFREHCLQKRQTGMIGAQHCSGSRVFPSFSAASGWRCRVGSCEAAQVPNVRLLGGDRSDPDTDTAVRNNEKPSAKS